MAPGGACACDAARARASGRRSSGRRPSAFLARQLLLATAACVGVCERCHSPRADGCCRRRVCEWRHDPLPTAAALRRVPERRHSARATAAAVGVCASGATPTRRSQSLTETALGCSPHPRRRLQTGGRGPADAPLAWGCSETERGSVVKAGERESGPSLLPFPPFPHQLPPSEALPQTAARRPNPFPQPPPPALPSHTPRTPQPP